MQIPLPQSAIDNNALRFEFLNTEEEFLASMRAYMEDASTKFPDKFRREAKKLVHEKMKTTSPHYIPKLENLLEQIEQVGESKLRNALETCLKRVAEQFDFSCNISFVRTLRLPDDGKVYPLPAGFGAFHLRSLDSLTHGCPRDWADRGGAIMPMFQSEAMWLSFLGNMPCAIRLITGSVDALTGEADQNKLISEPQNYLVRPDQPWIDGFKVDSQTVRQFVAMPIGKGYTVSEQLEPSKSATGLKIEVVPIKAEILASSVAEAFSAESVGKVMDEIFGQWCEREPFAIYCRRGTADVELCVSEDMGIAAGGKIQQEIYRDKRGVSTWDQSKAVQTSVYICNATAWTSITGELPPKEPITAEQYQRAGIPWFDFYRDDMEALKATKKMAQIKSIAQFQAEEGSTQSSEGAIDPQLIIQYGNTRRPDNVRIWARDFARS